MDMLKLVQERFSVRSFSTRPIEEEKLNSILLAARHAPTARNYQPQRIYVLRSADALERINSVCRCIFGAPLVLLICYDEARVWHNRLVPGYNSGEVDAAICCDHMMLTAWSLGIGSCWVGYFDPASVARVMELPDGVKPVALLPMGYPADDCKPLAGYHDVTRPMQDMVTFM